MVSADMNHSTKLERLQHAMNREGSAVSELRLDCNCGGRRNSSSAQ